MIARTALFVLLAPIVVGASFFFGLATLILAGMYALAIAKAVGQ